jgi:hypothetical protein
MMKNWVTPPLFAAAGLARLCAAAAFSQNHSARAWRNLARNFFQGEQFMTDKTISLDLYKANAALQLRLTRLLQESGHHWLQSMQQTSAEGLAETSAKIEGLLQSASWQTLATLPSESFWRLLRASDAKTAQQIALQNQAAFTQGVQQALQAWQEEITRIMAAASDSSRAGLPESWAAWLPRLAPHAKNGDEK